MTPRQALHASAVALVRRRLERRGYATIPCLDRRRGDFSILGRGRYSLTIAVRAARTSPPSPHSVTHKGKRYTYRYARLGWNLHTHRQLLTHPDVWALLWVNHGTLYLVPAAVVGSSKTVHLNSDHRRRWSGSKIERYANRFDLLPRAGKYQTNEPPQRVR